ncbi:MAG: UDP-4-amino-4,6-dideoxy-N-acetyl-beta-L-altrosamine transaminase [Rhodospirillaceae bacterium]
MNKPDGSFLPYGQQWIDDDDIDSVIQVLKSDFLTGGPAVENFEQAFAQSTGAKHAVACANGTAALHLSALALDLGPGDQVIVPSITFLSTANAARFVGADVIFADVDPYTGLMGPDELEDALARADKTKVKAVYPVHLSGQCADFEAIAKIALEHDLKIVEDACHALGGTYQHNGKTSCVGDSQYADMVVFSLHPVKIIAMGEGGVITTNNDTLADRLRRLRNQGMTRNAAEFQNKDMAFNGTNEANPWYYEMPELGFNYRASDIHCALGHSQLKKLPDFARQRKNLADHYDQRIAKLAPTVRPVDRMPHCHPAWHLYVVLIDFEATNLSRAQVMKSLRDQGVGSQVHYIPVHKQPYYQKLYGSTPLTGADSYYKHCLSLPLFVRMTEKDIDRIVDTLASVLSLT